MSCRLARSTCGKWAPSVVARLLKGFYSDAATLICGNVHWRNVERLVEALGGRFE